KNPIALISQEHNQLAVYAVDTAQVSFSIDFLTEPKSYKLEHGSNRSIISYFPHTDNTASRMTIIDRKHMLIKNIQHSSALFDFTFTQDIVDRTHYFPGASNSYLLVIASRNNHLVYLFDENSALHDGFPVEA